jgi:hypothetical protein
MIKQRNSQEFAGALDAVGHLAVLDAGFQTSAGVVMCDDDGGSPLF